MEGINKIKIRDLVGRIKNPEDTLAVRLMRENVRDNNMFSDVGRLRYTDGYISCKDIFKSITVFFNFATTVMLAQILDFGDCEGNYVADKVLAKESICGTYNKLLRSKFSIYNIKLAKWGVVIGF